MTLLGWELKKILRRRLTRAVLAVSLGLAVVSALSMGFANYSFGTDVGAPSWAARARCARATADAGSWHGPLTAETLRTARESCRAVLADPGGSLEGADAYLAGDILYAAARVYTEAGVIGWPDWPEQITALDDGAFDDFYTLRARNVAAAIDAAPPAQQAALRELNEEVTVPFVYDWVDGHYGEIVQMGNVLYLTGLLLCAAVAPLFCGEVRTGVRPVSHCTRHGRGRLAGAKLAAALLFAGVSFLVVAGVFVAIQLALFGGRGLAASLQITEPDCVLPLSYGQTEALLLAGDFLSCLAGVALTAALSARLESSLPVLLIVFGVLVFLRAAVLLGFLGGGLAPLGQALPFLTTLQDYLSNRLLVLPGGLVLPAPWYRLAVQPLWLAVGLPLAGWWYARRPMR